AAAPSTTAASATATLDVDALLVVNLLESDEEVVYVKDRENRYLRASLGCARQHGRTPEEMVGLDDFDLYAEAYAAASYDDEQRVMRTGRPIVQQKVRERWHDRPDSWVSVSTFPLRDAAGEVVGVYGISRDITSLVRAEQEMALMADATEAANAELRRVESQLRAVLDASTDAIAKYDRELRYQYINPAGEQSRGTSLEELIGRTDREIGMGDTSLALWEEALRRVLRTGEPDEIEFSVPGTDDGAEAWFHTTVSPDRDSTGAVVGVLTSTRDITATKQAEAALAHQAMHDSVTGLANRYLLMDRLGRAVRRTGRRGARLALCFVDVDHFKEINDTYGHDVGDRVLTELSARLTSVTRARDLVARLGGDEFVILREGVTDDDDVRRLAETVVRVLAEPVVDGPLSLRVSASVGVVLSADPRTTASELLRDADAAMYRAKEGGRNRFRVSGDDAEGEVSSATLVADLRRALDDGEFRLVYQPLLSLVDQQVLGFEALLRWDHPERGTLGPRDFIAFAERRGLMAGIGGWVLRAACAQLARWGRDVDDDADPLTIAVNVTVRQLRADGFVEQVAAVLAENDLLPSQLRLEVPERALLNEGAELAEVLSALDGIGVQLAVDDFGSSFAALALLPRIPVSVVKLGRFAELTDHPDLAAAVIEVAHGLGMSVVGAGIESSVQLRRLHALACDDGQGFLLGRPLDLPDVERLLAADDAARRARAFARRLGPR
ncbi:EAL domain-containing protein, partial [Actinotalea sp. AC32]|nr:EAL domain-containing protein [Actinotalea sp. AC32]